MNLIFSYKPGSCNHKFRNRSSLENLQENDNQLRNFCAIFGRSFTTEQLDFRGRDFREIWCCFTLLTCVQKIQVLLIRKEIKGILDTDIFIFMATFVVSLTVSVVDSNKERK